MSDYDWLLQKEVNKNTFALSKAGITSPRKSDIDGYVVHYTQGATTLSGNLTWGAKTRTGAHIYIRQDGTFYRAVPDHEVIGHAGKGRTHRHDLGNSNTIGIEIITSKDGVPNGDQLKTFHAFVKQDAELRGFDPATLGNRIVDHGSIAVGHKQAHEGRAAAALFNNPEVAQRVQDPSFDWDGYAQETAEGRPIMSKAVNVNPSSYVPHQPGTGRSFASEVRAPKPDPAAFSDTKDEAAGMRRPEADRDIVSELQAQPQATTVPGITTSNIPPSDPSFDYNPAVSVNVAQDLAEAPRVPSVAEEAPAAQENFSFGSAQVVPETGVSTADLNETIHQQGVATISPERRKHAEARAFGRTAPVLKPGILWDTEEPGATEAEKEKVLREELEVEIRAAEYEKGPDLTPQGDPYDASPISRVGQLQAHQSLLEKTQEDSTTILEFFEGEMLLRNSVTNSLEEAFAQFSSVRNKIDPNFNITPEMLSAYPARYHDYLLSAKNPLDWAFRAQNMDHIMEGERRAQEVWDESQATFWPVYMFSGLLTLSPYIAGGYFGGAAGAQLLARQGVSTMTAWMAGSFGAEAALGGIDAYLGKKGGVYNDTEAIIVFSGAVVGGILGGYLSGRQAIAALNQVNVAVDTFNMSKGVVKDGSAVTNEQLIESGIRPIIRPEKSVVVHQVDEKIEAAARNFDQDQELIAKRFEEAYNPVNFTRDTPNVFKDSGAFSEAFDRQAHTATQSLTGWLSVPKGVTPQEFLNSAQGAVVALVREADRVLDEARYAVQVRLPKGSEYLDLERFGRAMPGSFAVRADGFEIVPTGRLPSDPKLPRDLRSRNMARSVLDKKTGKTRKAKAPYVEAKVKTKVNTTAKESFVSIHTQGGKASPELVMEQNLAGGVKAAKKQNASVSPLGGSGGAAAADDVYSPLRLTHEYDQAMIQDLVEQVRYRTGDFDEDTMEAFMFSRFLKKYGWRWILPVSDSAIQDENPLMRHMAAHLFDVGYGKLYDDLVNGVGEGGSTPLDLRIQNYVGAKDGMFMRNIERIYTNYKTTRAKAEGKNLMQNERLARAHNMFDQKWLSEFWDSVDKYDKSARLGQAIEPDYPQIKEASELLDNHYAELLKDLNDPGRVVGKPRVWGPQKTNEEGELLFDEWGEPIRDVVEGFRPVQGFGDVAYGHMSQSPKWRPIHWDARKIDDLHREFGDNALRDLITGSLRSAGLFNEDYHTLKIVQRMLEREGVELAEEQAAQRGVKKVRTRKTLALSKLKEYLEAKAKDPENTPDMDIPAFLKLHFGGERLKHVQELIEDGLQKRAEAVSNRMVRTIMEAKKGIHHIHSHPTNAVIGLARSIMREEKSGVLRDWAEELLERQSKPMSGGKSGRHSFRRAKLDEEFQMFFEVRQPDGSIARKPKKVSDLWNSDQMQNARHYLRRMGGRVMMGSWEYRSPPQAGRSHIDIQGIASDDEWQKFVVDPVNAVESQLLEPQTAWEHLERFGRTKPQRELELAFDYFTGNVPPTPKALAFLRNLTYARFLGNAGFAQFSEVANLIGHNVLNAPKIKKVFTKEIPEALSRMGKDAQSYTDARRLLDHAGIGFDLPRGALGQAVEHDYMGVSANARFLHASHAASRFVFITSGLGPLQQAQQKAFGMSWVNDMVHFAREAGGDFDKLPLKQRLDILSAMNNQENARKIIKLLSDDRYVQAFDDGGYWSFSDFNEHAPGFDTNLWYQFREGMTKFVYANIQTNSYGNQHRMLHNRWFQVAMVLKSFAIGSYQKQVARNFRDIGNAAAAYRAGESLSDASLAMARPGLKIALQVVFGAMSWMLLKEIGWLGLSDEERQTKRDETFTMDNLVKAGVTRSGALGLIPTLYNTPVSFLGMGDDISWGMEGYKGSGLFATLNPFDGAVAQTAKSWSQSPYEGLKWLAVGDEFDADAGAYVQKKLTNLWYLSASVNLALGLMNED